MKMEVNYYYSGNPLMVKSCKMFYSQHLLRMPCQGVRHCHVEVNFDGGCECSCVYVIYFIYCMKTNATPPISHNLAIIRFVE